MNPKGSSFQKGGSSVVDLKYWEDLGSVLERRIIIIVRPNLFTE